MIRRGGGESAAPKDSGGEFTFLEESHMAKRLDNKVKKVRIKLPVERGRDTDVYVSVNDYSCVIKRGEKVEVPWFVAEALRDSEDAETKTYEYIAKNSK